MKRLVIVESPTKAKTIRQFLSSDYQIEASMGHVRDLPANADEIPKEFKGQAWARLGVNVDVDFTPLYIVPSKKKKVVSQLKNALKSADELLIATDEDREGESIGWHLLEVLAPKVPVKRMVFHEITQEAIRAALENTRDIDTHLVAAQEARRVLDRLVGYSISPLLWKKIAPKLSAGRVQSVAVRLMVLREQERLAFMPAQYWDLKARLQQQAETSSPFDALLHYVDGVRLATGRDFDDATGKLHSKLTLGRDVLLLEEAQAKTLVAKAKEANWQVDKLEERRSNRSPAAPFTTSTLQQEASRKLNLAAKDTMRVAQSLYENGYITYMRTDSTNLSQEAVEASRRAVEKRYGSDYLSPKPRRYSSKARNAQEAHEAIRPAGKDMKTKDEHGLGGIEAALYDLIWKRTVATQMADARLRFVTATIAVQTDEVLLHFRASGRNTEFAGFFRAYVEGSDDPEAALDDRDQPLPVLQEGERLRCQELSADSHETKAPARFTEASLVKTLEQEGIGRPSTYASIIDTVIRRGYVRKQGSQLQPTFTAFATNNLLEQQFQQLVDTGFTAAMEQVLDDIASGSTQVKPYLRSFYFGNNNSAAADGAQSDSAQSKNAQGLALRVDQALEAVDAREVSTLRFAKWEPYVVRVGKYGPYVEGEIDGETQTSSLPSDLAPADIDAALLAEMLAKGNAADDVLGEHPEHHKAVLLRQGPYGPYVQLGSEDEKKPKRVSLPKGLKPEDVDFAIALELLALPRTVGMHPDTGKPITVQIGRFGPYAKHDSTSASLGKDDDVLRVGYERALEIIRKKERKNQPLRSLGEHPETGESIAVFEGRYGPYVKHRKINASLPKELTPEMISLQQALALLAEKESSKGGRKTSRSTSKTSKTSTAKANKSSRKRSSANSSTALGKASKPAKNKASPKTTPKDLEPFLEQLDSNVAAVVMRLEGMRNFRPQDINAVTRDLGMSEDSVRAAHKRGMFKLRMAYGKARKDAHAA